MRRKRVDGSISFEMHHKGLREKGVKCLAKAMRTHLQLTKVVLEGNDLDSTILAPLIASLDSGIEGHPNVLHTLKLECNSIGDGIVTKLASTLPSNTSVRVLSLRGNRVGDVGKLISGELTIRTLTVRIVC